MDDESAKHFDFNHFNIFLLCVFHKFQSDFCQALSWRQYSHSLCELNFVMLHRCDSWLLLMKLPTKRLLMLLLYVEVAFDERIGNCLATAWREHFQSLETYCQSLESDFLMLVVVAVSLAKAPNSPVRDAFVNIFSIIWSVLNSVYSDLI